MNGKQLKNSILQWAIQGKLVPQDPNDEPASALLERIREEKARLVKEGKIKKDKNESIIFRGDDNSHYEKFPATGEVRCIDDEIPFDIPDTWEWCRIRNISQSYIGLTYAPTDVNNKGIIVLRSSNIKDGKLDLTDIVRVNKEVSGKLQVDVHDIIICARNGSKKLVGKSALITEMSEPMTFGAFMAICKTQLYDYVYLFLQSDLFFSQLREVSGTTTINQLTQNNFNSFIIPIPPKEEQERIITKCNQLFPIIEKYSVAQNKLDTLNSEIKSILKKSILQEAIQGRLVEQCETDEPVSKLLERIQEEKRQLVKQGKLKAKDLTNSTIFRGDDNKYYEQVGDKCVEISEEIPFDIPDNWEWVRLKEIAMPIKRGKSPVYAQISNYLAFAQKCNTKKGDIDLSLALYFDNAKVERYDTMLYLKKGDIVVNSTGNGTLGRVGFFNCEYPQGIVGIIPDSHITPVHIIQANSKYIYHCLKNSQHYLENKGEGGTNQKELKPNIIAELLIPIPPLAEQKRIVERIEELYSRL